MPTNRVCLKCGECNNEQEIFKLAYKAQHKKKKESRRRKAFAKQLWDDGCNK